jgi:hypothetical protein
MDSLNVLGIKHITIEKNIKKAALKKFSVLKIISRQYEREATALPTISLAI